MKTKLVIGIFTLVFSASCKKNYSCQCSDAGTVSETYTINDTKKNAKKRCESNEHCPGCQYFAEHKCEIK